MRQAWVLWGFGAWLAITVVWWLLAFAPLPIPDSALARFREVCFGMQPNGLPDTSGWLQLILGPVGALGFLVVVWGDELKRELSALADRTAGKLAIGVVVLGLCFGLIQVGNRVALANLTTFAVDEFEKPERLPDDYPRLNWPAPVFSLVDQSGNSFTQENFLGQVSVVTFAYAHCQTICPVIVQRTMAGAELASQQPQVVVLTLDPWRDTPSSLPRLAEKWELTALRDAHLLSGPVTNVEATLHDWKTGSARDEKTGEIAHPALVYVLDATGQIVYAFNNPTPEWIAEAVARLN